MIHRYILYTDRYIQTVRRYATYIIKQKQLISSHNSGRQKLMIYIMPYKFRRFQITVSFFLPQQKEKWFGEKDTRRLFLEITDHAPYTVSHHRRHHHHMNDSSYSDSSSPQRVAPRVDSDFFFWKKTRSRSSDSWIWTVRLFVVTSHTHSLIYTMWIYE